MRVMNARMEALIDELLRLAGGDVLKVQNAFAQTSHADGAVNVYDLKKTITQGNVL